MTRYNRTRCVGPRPRMNPRSFVEGYENEHQEFKSWLEGKERKAVNKEHEKRVGFAMALFLWIVFAHVLMIAEYLLWWRKIL